MGENRIDNAMNSLTHFLFASNLLILAYSDSITLKTIFLFAFIFGVMVDIDVFIRMGILGHKQAITRTWLQEPFGLIVVGGIFATMLEQYFGSPHALLVLIPFSSHVFLDYISIHQARPLDPFSKKVYNVGWIQTRLLNKKDLTNWSGLNENYFTLINALVLVILLVTL